MPHPPDVASSHQTALRDAAPDDDRVHDVLVGATHGIGVRSILDLGSDAGETALRVVAKHPNARLVALDASAEMAERTSERLSDYDAEVVVWRPEEPLPEGPFDLVVAAFALDPLDEPGRALLFQRIAEALRPGGRLVLAAAVTPETALALPVTALDRDVAQPPPLHELLDGLRGAGLAPAVRWRRIALAVLTADRPGEMELPSLRAAGARGGP